MQYYLIPARLKKKDFIFEVWMNLVRVHNTYADNKIFNLREIHHIKLEEFCKSSDSKVNRMLEPFRRLTIELVRLYEAAKEMEMDKFTLKWNVIHDRLVTEMERV